MKLSFILYFQTENNSVRMEPYGFKKIVNELDSDERLSSFYGIGIYLFIYLKGRFTPGTKSVRYIWDVKRNILLIHFCEMFINY